MPAIRYRIDFRQMSMDTQMPNDKRNMPNVTLIQNADMGEKGRFRQRQGIDEHSTHASPNPSGTAVNAVSPINTAVFGGGSSSMAVIVDQDIYTSALLAGGWTDTGVNSLADTFPYRIAWGTDVSGNDIVYFADTTGGVIGVYPSTALVYGSADDASNPWDEAEAVESYLNKLWVGNTTGDTSPDSGSTDRVRWSVTGDDTDFYSEGSGTFDLGNDYAQIQGFRVYRNRLYILTSASLWVLTGTTSATFGAREIRPQHWGVGSTMYVTGDFLWYCDTQGIWKFNGSQGFNIVDPPVQSGLRGMTERWETLSATNDILKATASWDDYHGIYRVWFPTANEMWNYYYNEGRWDIHKFASTDSIRVISPQMMWAQADEERPTPYFLGADTNGKVLRYPKNQQDDGNAITSIYETGYMSVSDMIGVPAGSEGRITRIEIGAIQQDAAYNVKLDMEAINKDGRQTMTQQTTTVADAGASANTFHTRYLVQLDDEARQGEYFLFKLTLDSDNVRGDIRYMDIWIDPQSREYR